MGIHALLVLLVLAVGQLVAQAPVSATSPINTPRYDFPGTLLNTGLVLVTGGNTSDAALTNSAELYNPQAGTWRFTAFPMGNARSGHTATKLADGRVLVASGLNVIQPNSGGGGTTALYTNTSEVFDPSTETFAQTGSTTYPHGDNAAVLLNDGRVLVAGQNPNGGPATAEVWGPSTGQWSVSNSNLGTRPGLAIALLLDGRVLVTGGGSNEVDLFNPVANTWQLLTPLLYGRSTHTASTLPNGTVLVASGYDPVNTRTSVDTAEIYDITANGGLGGSVLVPGTLTVGGVQGSAARLPNGDVLLAGGYSYTAPTCANTTTNRQLYHFASGTLSTETPMLSSRALFPMMLMPSGQVLSAGGINEQCSSGTVLNQAELWGTGTATAPPFLYATNISLNNISGYSIDPSTGALTPLPGSPFAGGLVPDAITIDPSNRFAYVTNLQGSSVSGYAIIPSTGALTPLSGSPFAAGNGPDGLGVDPLGRFVYVNNQNDNNLSGYAINQQTGALTPVVGGPFPTGQYPVYNVVFHPNGRFVYNGALKAGTVSGFAIDAQTGALTPVPGSPFVVGNQVVSVAIEPKGRYLYVTLADQFVYAFQIDAATGSLSAISGSPFGIGLLSHWLAVEPTARFLFVSNEANNEISVLGINQSSGALSPILGSPFPTGSLPGGPTVDPSGKFLYVSNNDTTISAFRIDPVSGSLSPVPGSPFTGYGQQASLAIAAPTLTIGAINVTTNLPTATFTITGPATYNGSGTSFTQAGAPAGVYSISYGAVAGYGTPAPQTQTLGSGGSITFSGSYTPAGGTINVTAQRNGQPFSGATFVLSKNGMFYTAGTAPSVQSNAPPGSYAIAWGSLLSFIDPPSATQNLAAGGAISFNGAYESTTSLGTPSPTNPGPYSNEPVNTATGDYYTSHTDLQVPGKGLSFTFTRSYNSLDTYIGPLGVGWTHSYNIFLRQASGLVIIKEADGHEDVFSPTSGGGYTAQTPGLFDSLRMNADASFTLTRKNQTQLHFSSAGSLLTIVDRNGNALTLAYSGSNLAAIADSSGRLFKLGYDVSNRLISLTDPLGRILHYTYDAIGNLASFQDALNGTTQYAYDAGHRMTSAIDPRGNMYLQNTFDSQGRVVVQKNARGFSTTFAYDTPSPGTTTITDPLGDITKQVHDSSLRWIQTIDAMGGITAFTYSPNNLKLSSTDPLGRIQTFAYDGNGNLTGATDSNGKTTQFAYSTTNDVLQIMDRLGRVTHFTYDSKGNLLSALDPAGNTTAFTYSPAGQVATAKNARNFTTAFSYDAAGNLGRVADALGGTVQMTYDAVGRLLSVKNQLGNTSTRAYDANNRLTVATDPLGNATQFAYDPNGNMMQLTDANTKVTHYLYDSTNKLAQVTDAIGGITIYGYDGNTNLLSVTDANGHTTVYVYDPLQRLKTTTDPLGNQKHYSYDGVSNVTSTLDGNGKTNAFSYDVLNRLIAMALSNGKSVSYTYDAVGNRLTMTDWRGATNYSSDLLNRVLTVATPDGKTVAYGYDALGNRSKTTYPDGKTVQYQYDALSRLTKATDSAGRTTNYTYDPASNLTLTTQPNGTSSINVYDPANRLISILNQSGFVPVSAFAYQLDKVGNRVAAVSTAVGINQYGYDGLYRLTSWTDALARTTKYAYDAVGNRVSVAAPSGTTNYTYDAADELLSAGPTSFAYDHNGNQVTKTTASGTVGYNWDALNRLISVAGAGLNTQYQYDGDGNRVGQEVGASAYQYSNDVVTGLPVVLNENGPDGNIDYAYGLSLISAVSPSFQSFYQFDGLGSVSTVTNPAGTIAANYAYDPWGQAISPVAPPFGLDTLGTKNKYKFTGEAQDPASNLVFLRARYYDSSTGRFLSRDALPVRVSPGSQYQFARSNPVRFVDPTGLSAVESVNGDQFGAGVLERIQNLGDLAGVLGDRLQPTYNFLADGIGGWRIGSDAAAFRVLSGVTLLSTIVDTYQVFSDPNAGFATKLGRASSDILFYSNPFTGIPLAIAGIIAPEQTTEFKNKFVDTTLNGIVEGGAVKGVRIPGLADFTYDVILNFGSNTTTVFNAVFR